MFPDNETGANDLARTAEDGMPLDMQMDLLADGELPEDGRRALLLALEREPGVRGERWRELAMRFLQRQVERESVRQLMAGGSVVPASVLHGKREARGVWKIVGWPGMRRLLSTAAGLLIVATTVLVVEYGMRHGNGVNEVQVTLPAAAVDYEHGVPVSVSVVKAPEDAARLWETGGAAGANATGHGGANSRQSWVIQKDDKGNALWIWVGSTRTTVY